MLLNEKTQYLKKLNNGIEREDNKDMNNRKVTYNQLFLLNIYSSIRQRLFLNQIMSR